MAWRVADAVIAEIPAYTKVKKLCEYIGNGVTRTRMRSLAVTPLRENGLGLFGERSRAFKHVFGVAIVPSLTIDLSPT